MKFEDILKNYHPLKGDNIGGYMMGLALTVLGIGFVFAFWIFSQVSVMLGFKVAEIASNHRLNNFPDEAKFAFFIIFLSFGLGLLGAILWRKFFERMPITTLFTAAPKFRWHLFVLGLIIGTLLIVISGMVSAATSDNDFETIPTRIAALGVTDYIILLILYFCGFCVQATFEEVFVRAQIVQYLRRLKAPIIVAIVLANSFFGLLHYQPEIDTSVILMTALMGVSFSYAVWRTNGIELSMGAHIINNFIVAAILGQLDNNQVDDQAYIGGLVYFVGFVCLLEVFLKLFPALLEDRLFAVSKG